jgi:hypothetical protein
VSGIALLGIPSISVVFGSSTAGGAYSPGMSDYVIMVKVLFLVIVSDTIELRTSSNGNVWIGLGHCRIKPKSFWEDRLW